MQKYEQVLSFFSCHKNALESAHFSVHTCGEADKEEQCEEELPLLDNVEEEAAEDEEGEWIDPTTVPDLPLFVTQLQRKSLKFTWRKFDGKNNDY